MKKNFPVYLDCAATTPVEPEVMEILRHFLEVEYGNEGSRTHEFGARAKQAVQQARNQIANVLNCRREEVIFTSGATESNNLAILGLAEHGLTAGKKHVISSAIEHKAVLEPLEYLEKRGFEVELLKPNSGGWIDPDDLRDSLRPDTLLVSLMHANNETGIIQPLESYIEILKDQDTFLHVDAAQTFGKLIEPLQNPRIDLMSISGHKIYGPKGIGALIARKRGYRKTPLTPLLYGGGQERGLRPGTLPVHLIAALGKAAELALQKHKHREGKCREFRDDLLSALKDLHPVITGDQDRALAHIINLRIEGVNSEAALLALKDTVAASNGSACTSASYTPSHVLLAMGFTETQATEALRFSWSHLTDEVDWNRVKNALSDLV